MKLLLEVKVKRLPLIKYSLTMKALASQRGDMLIESLIGLLLFAIAGMGVSHITAKTAVAQRDGKVQDQVINELRSMVINRQNVTDLCSDGSSYSTTNFNKSVEVLSGCDATTASISVGGATVTIGGVYAPMVLTTKLSDDDDNSLVRVGGQDPASGS